MADDPRIPTELIEHLNRRDVVLFVGDALDGASQHARLAATLVDACGAHSVCAVPDCRRDGRCTSAQRCAVPLTRAAQLYESQHSRYSLLSQVCEFVETHYAARPVTPLFQVLATLPVDVVVTTAYDERLEAALEREGRRYRTVVRDEDVPFGDPRYVKVVRLHGTVSQRTSLVLTEDDAADLLGRLSPTIRVVLQGLLAEKTLLFLGYGLDDPHFLTIYRQVTEPVARVGRPAYAVQPAPNPLVVKRWQAKIALLDAAPEPFLTRLVGAVRVQAIKDKQAVLPSEPYKFLDYYQRDDAAIFFGRDLEAELLKSTILAHKLTVFYGRSGTGKTSLLLARVAPALEEAGYHVAYARMLSEPASEVKAAVCGLKSSEQLSHRDRGRRLVDVLAEALPPAGRLVVVLDQFEEFFVRQGEAVRRAFAQEMADCLQTSEVSEDFRSLDVRFALSLRDDYLGMLDEMTSILPGDVFHHRFRLENLTREKALLAILKPAEAFGLSVEEPLRDRLIADLEDQGLEPANLQIVLYRLYRDAIARGLWDEGGKRGTGLTLARYEVLGGTREILAGYLEEVLAGLPDLARQQAQAVLKSMVTAERTKAAVTGQEIGRGDLVARAGLGEAELDRLLAYLRGRRVVRKFGEEAAEGGRYELAHEVMVVKVWGWVSDEELRVLDIRDSLRRAMGDWGKFGHLLGREKLELMQSCCEQLALDGEEMELLFRSALAAGYEVPYWFERACQEGVPADEIALEGLRSAKFRTRAAAVAALGELGEQFADAMIPMLADDYPQVRAAAIQALERLQPDGAWRRHLKHECYVPAGDFVMGDDKSDRKEEKPAHRVVLGAFYIGKYPVTNADYKRYMDDRERAFDIPPGKADHPVVSIPWYDARDYAAWAGMRLLTEAEWEKSASWEQGSMGEGEQGGVGRWVDPLVKGREAPAGKKRTYPWGDKFDKNRCNTHESGIEDTTPVGNYSPAGDSPYGCADMAGNVWEWTSTLKRDYPYQADDGREDPHSSDWRVLRGGSWYGNGVRARSAYRNYVDPNFRDYFDGVRMGLSSTSSL